MKVKLELELEYDERLWHGDDPEATDWFYDKILSKDGNLILHSNEVGDTIGEVRLIGYERA